MRLEDTIKHRLFRISTSDWFSRNAGSNRCVIECKGNIHSSIPLCIPLNAFPNLSLIYKMMRLREDIVYERSTPRALYNMILDSGFNRYFCKCKLKNSVYYTASGVLFNEDKDVLFYFAYTLDTVNGRTHMRPRLYLTPELLADAAMPAKPMEKFFMSTILPYIIDSPVVTKTGYIGNAVVEIDNDVNSTFFVPDCSLVTTTPVDKINDKLNDILADNADVLSMFTGNYINAR